MKVVYWTDLSKAFLQDWKLRYNEKLYRQNSETKWMKVPLINSTENKYNTVLTLWVTFCEALELIENFF